MSNTMVWAIAILCLSMSCEPIPTTSGWYDTFEDCARDVHLIDRAWQPTVGHYSLACVTRIAV